MNDLKWHLSTSPVFLVHQEAGMHPLLTYLPHGQPKDFQSRLSSGQTSIMSGRYQTNKCRDLVPNQKPYLYLKYGFHKKYFQKNEQHFFPPFFSRSVLIGGKFIFTKKSITRFAFQCNFNQSALIWKKTGEKSVQLVRVASFRSDFL